MCFVVSVVILFAIEGWMEVDFWLIEHPSIGVKQFKNWWGWWVASYYCTFTFHLVGRARCTGADTLRQWRHTGWFGGCSSPSPCQSTESHPGLWWVTFSVPALPLSGLISTASCSPWLKLAELLEVWTPREHWWISVIDSLKLRCSIQNTLHT